MPYIPELFQSMEEVLSNPINKQLLLRHAITKLLRLETICLSILWYFICYYIWI